MKGTHQYLLQSKGARELKFKARFQMSCESKQLIVCFIRLVSFPFSWSLSDFFTYSKFFATQ